jgi:leader peptidase (prepilin peptidase)/N-methyltransferase
VAGGLLVGPIGFFWALFAASATGLAIVFGLRFVALQAPGPMDRLAFGALLAPALFVVWLSQQAPLFLAGP